MPELPEIRAHAERLADALIGDTLERVRLIGFSALKTVRPAAEDAVGAPLVAVRTRGKHLLLDFGETTHVVHLMQAGRLRPDPKEAAKPRGGLFRWTFSDAGSWLLTEAGTERKAGVWVLAGDVAAQAPLDGLGPEADEVATSDLQAIFAERSARLHTILRDQRAIAGLGRMLANEICFRAGMSPFVQTRSLGPEDAERIHSAIAESLSDALGAERGRADMSSSSDRPSLVHNRTGEACTICDGEIRAVEYNAYTVNYCPTCQTDGKILADNTMSKFGVLDAPAKKKPRRSRR